MSRRRIAHAERRIETAHNHSNTRRWTIAVRALPAYEGASTKSKYMLAPRGLDVTSSAAALQLTPCSVRYSRAKRKARRLGLRVHTVKVIKEKTR